MGIHGPQVQKGGEQIKRYQARESERDGLWAANLPTCFREARNPHAKHGTTGTGHRRTIHGAREVLLAAGSTRKLHGQSLAFEVTAICFKVNGLIKGIAKAGPVV